MITTECWPSDRFYWAVLSCPGIKGAGVLPAALLPLLEDDIPLPAEDIHAVFLSATDNRVIVCAVKRDVLDILPPELLSLSPQSLPPPIESTGINPRSFNLLVGPYEPRAMRSARNKRNALVSLTLLISCLLVSTGLDRRTAQLNRHAAEVVSTTHQLAARLGPHVTPANIVQELHRVRDMHAALAIASDNPDITNTLATVLQHWPTTSSSILQSVSVSAGGVLLSVAIDGDSSSFLKAFKVPEGLALDEPRLTLADNVTRMNLKLTFHTGGG